MQSGNNLFLDQKDKVLYHVAFPGESVKHCYHLITFFAEMNSWYRLFLLIMSTNKINFLHYP